MRARGYSLYVAAITLLLVLGCGYALGTQVVGPAAADAQARLGEPAWLVLWSCFLVAGLAPGGLRGLSLWATAAELIWGDLDRLLRGRARIRLVLLGTMVLAPVALVAVATGSTTVAGSGAWLWTTAAVAAVMGGVSALLPHLDRAAWVGLVQWAATVTGLALLSWSAGAVVIGAFVAVLTVLFLWARAGLPAGPDGPLRWYATPPRWELARAGRAVQAWHHAAMMFDAAPLELERDLRAGTRRQPVTFRRPLVVVLSRIASAQRSVAGLLLIPLVAGATDMWGEPAGVTALVVTTYGWASAVTPALDAFLDQEALRRTYAHRPAFGVELASSSTFLVVSLVMLSATLAGLGAWHMLATVLVAALAWVRRAQGRRLAGRVGALLATPAGGIPVDLANRAVAGPDMLVLGLVLLAVADPATVCLLLALLLLLLGNQLRASAPSV